MVAPNLLLNTGLSIWQRGTANAKPTNFKGDRWQSATPQKPKA